MKRFFFWLWVTTLAALNWAALHDIIKGEPNVWMEWTVVSDPYARAAFTRVMF